MLASYDPREIFEPNRKVEVFVFVIAGIATALAFLAGLFLAISFSRPLEKLRRVADRFGKGDFGDACVGGARRLHVARPH